MKFTHIPYGGDYNPEQWPQAIRDEDMRLMPLANWNIATVPVFGWAALEPSEGVFTFEWLDDILDQMAAVGIQACLATATASQPAWLDETYPDVLVTEQDGRKRRHGNRHSFCPCSPNYRHLSVRLASKLAERYREHPALAIWHVNNEYGTYCYCDQCAREFRRWLQDKYGSLEALNAAWYTQFWGHTFTKWDHIEPPDALGEQSMQALKIDYYRFQSNALLNCYRAEADALRAITPDVPITTNFMGSFFPLNYHEWAQHVDIAAWDNYPWPSATPADIAFTHALMRGLKGGQPFMLMEQSPSQQNWQPYNRVKAPGQLRLQSFQAVAQGADSVMYFQWRRSRGGIEKLHGAVVEHGGTSENRVFREVAALGQELKDLGDRTIGKRVPARAAILFGWENWWSLAFSSGPSKDLDYVKTLKAAYTAFFELGLMVDVVAPDADLSDYDLIVAPLLQMMPASVAASLEARVRAGATLLTGPLSGLVNETDLVHPEGSPGPLRAWIGMSVEETDALLPEQANGLRWADGEAHTATILCERLRLEGASRVATYTDDFYAGEPALTRQSVGTGSAFYLGTIPDGDGWRKLIDQLAHELDITCPLGTAPPPGVEVSVRGDLLFLLNHGEACEIAIGTPPLRLRGGGRGEGGARPALRDLLTGQLFTVDIRLDKRDVFILKLD